MFISIPKVVACVLAVVAVISVADAFMQSPLEVFEECIENTMASKQIALAAEGWECLNSYRSSIEKEGP